MSNHTYCHHLKHEPHAHIDCVQARCDGQDPYPVLHIGDAATFWPSREQLVAIRDAIDAYLTKTPSCDVKPFTPEETAKIAAGIEAEDRAPHRHSEIVRDMAIQQEDEYTDAEVQEMF